MNGYDFGKRSARKREELREKARRQWEQWDAFTDEQKKFLHDFAPDLPRPDER